MPRGERSGPPRAARRVALASVVALAGCVDVDVTRVAPAVSEGAVAGSRGAPVEGYLCAVVTPSPVRSLFTPEWRRLTAAIATPSRKAGPRVTVDFSGFDKAGNPAAFPCVPVERDEPVVVALEVEGSHGAVERAAQQALSSVSDTVVADVVPVKAVSRASDGLGGVLLSHGAAAAVLGSEEWCAHRPGTCFAALSGGASTFLVGPRGSDRRIERGRIVDGHGAPLQGVTIALAFEASPRAEALPAECRVALEDPAATSLGSCTVPAATAEMTRADGRAFRELVGALTVGSSEALQAATRARVVREAREGLCAAGRFEGACARAAAMEGELTELARGEEAALALKAVDVCGAAGQVSSAIDAARGRVARHPHSRAIVSQSKVLERLAHDAQVACFAARVAEHCGADCPTEWLGKVRAVPGARLVLGYDEDGCRAGALGRFVGVVADAAEGLTEVEEIRETVSAAASAAQARTTRRWCGEVARLSESLRTSRAFRELDAADAALEADATLRTLASQAPPVAQQVSALLDEGAELRRRLPGLFGSAEDGAPKLREGAQDRLESAVSAHVRSVRELVGTGAGAVPVLSGRL